MADYYQQLSLVIDGLTDDERKWVAQIVATLEIYDMDEDHEEWPRLQFVLDQFGLKEVDELDDHQWPCFETDFHDDYIHIYSWEGFNSEHLTMFLQAFIRKFRPDDVIGVEYANTCSKLRTDGFGGGWIAISKDDVQWGTTATAVDEAIEAMKGGTACSSSKQG
jgi:hypothetical protein